MAAIELHSTSLISDANLQAYYQLEDVNDHQGSYNLTNNGTVAFNAAKFNNGADFGTSNSSKWLSNAGLYNTTVNSAKTIALWVKITTELTSSDAWYNLAELRYNSDGVAYQIVYARESGVNGITIARQVCGAGWESYKYNIALGTTNWHHIALVVSGTTLSNYVDGELRGSDDIILSGACAVGGDGFAMGKTLTGGFGVPAYANAIIDDVAVFNRALTSAEVSTLYTDAITSVSEESEYYVISHR